MEFFLNFFFTCFFLRMNDSGSIYSLKSTWDDCLIVHFRCIDCFSFDQSDHVFSLFWFFLSVNVTYFFWIFSLASSFFFSGFFFTATRESGQNDDVTDSRELWIHCSKIENGFWRRRRRNRWLSIKSKLYFRLSELQTTF